MRPVVLALTAAAAATLAAAAAAFSPSVLAGGGPGCHPPAPGSGLEVHEWGTFTSLQGSDGVALEGLEHEEAHLPPFVHSRSEVRSCPLRAQGWKGLEVQPTGVTQKMETPVIYVRSAAPRRLRVRVDFVKGLISQWYPVTDLLGPPENAADAGPLDVAKVERSFLEWEVDVLAKDAERPAEVPTVADAEDPWLLAREVHANWLRTAPRKGPERAGPVEAEKYLFYRGLGAFELPLKVRAERGGKGVLSMAAAAGSARGVVAFEVRGKRGRVQWIGEVPAGKEVPFAHGSADAWWGPVDEVVEKLEAIVGRELVAAGLREDEARAMVRTWSASWFRAEGARVLWIVPRAVVDAMLPLRIDPRPDALERVLVGRLEYLTPEDEDALEEALRLRLAASDEDRARAEARLALSGRFLEAHVRRVLARTGDASVRESASAVLRSLDGTGDR